MLNLNSLPIIFIIPNLILSWESATCATKSSEKILFQKNILIDYAQKEPEIMKTDDAPLYVSPIMNSIYVFYPSSIELLNYKNGKITKIERQKYPCNVYLDETGLDVIHTTNGPLFHIDKCGFYGIKNYENKSFKIVTSLKYHEYSTQLFAPFFVFKNQTPGNSELDPHFYLLNLQNLDLKTVKKDFNLNGYLRHKNSLKLFFNKNLIEYKISNSKIVKKRKAYSYQGGFPKNHDCHLSFPKPQLILSTCYPLDDDKEIKNYLFSNISDNFISMEKKDSELLDNLIESNNDPNIYFVQHNGEIIKYQIFSNKIKKVSSIPFNQKLRGEVILFKNMLIDYHPAIGLTIYDTNSH